MKNDGNKHPIAFSVTNFQEALLVWYSQNKAQHPWRLMWHSHKDPYPVWISEIMLQQTTLAAMIPIFEKFMMRFPTLRTLACAKEDEIKKTVQGLGYYRRFSLLHKGAQALVEKSSHYILWPKSYEEWLDVPGVGDYTAAALSSITLNEAVPVIDGNVIRVLCRIFDIRKPSNDASLKKELKILASELLSHEKAGDFNQALMEMGQKVCRPLNPNCDSCILQKFCLAYKKQSVHLAPQAKLRKEVQDVKLRLHILEKDKVYGIYTRPQKAKFLKSTSGFITELGRPKGFHLDGWEQSGDIPQGRHLGSVRHSITHHRIHADVYVLPWKQWKGVQRIQENIQWLDKKQLASHLVSSLDLKAWTLLQKGSLGDLFSN